MASSFLGIDYDFDAGQALENAAWAAEGGLIGGAVAGPVGIAVGVGIGGAAGYLIGEYSDAEDSRTMGEITRAAAIDARNATYETALAQGLDEAAAQDAANVTEQGVWRFSLSLASQKGSAWSSAIAEASAFFAGVQNQLASMASFFRDLYTVATKNAEQQAAVEAYHAAQTAVGAPPSTTQAPPPPTEQFPGKPKPSPPAPVPKGPPWALWIVGLIALSVVALVVMKMRAKKGRRR
jgi:hypothetical protein